MSQEKSTVNITYPPILAILGAVLVVLKLMGEISIPWIWVLAPFWAPWVLILGSLFVVFVVAFLVDWWT